MSDIKKAGVANPAQPQLDLTDLMGKSSINTIGLQISEDNPINLYYLTKVEVTKAPKSDAVLKRGVILGKNARPTVDQVEEGQLNYYFQINLQSLDGIERSNVSSIIWVENFDIVLKVIKQVYHAITARELGDDYPMSNNPDGGYILQHDGKDVKCPDAMALVNFWTARMAELVTSPVLVWVKLQRNGANVKADPNGLKFGKGNFIMPGVGEDAPRQLVTYPEEVFNEIEVVKGGGNSGSTPTAGRPALGTALGGGAIGGAAVKNPFPNRKP